MAAATSTNAEIARARTAAGAATTSDIEAQLQQLREDISSLAKTVGAVGSSTASEVKGKARRAASDATDASMQMVEAAREQAISFERDLEARIRKTPIQSIAIAAGVGFVFALLSRR